MQKYLVMVVRPLGLGSGGRSKGVVRAVNSTVTVGDTDQTYALGNLTLESRPVLRR